MSFQGFQTNFPQTALIDLKTGLLTKDGRLLLTALWQRTGSGPGIIPIVSPPLTATGTTQATALGLVADWNRVTSSPPVSPTGPFSGVVMANLSPGNDIWVWNADTAVNHNLNVYPFLGAAIGAGVVNAFYQLSPGLLVYFQCWSTTLIIPIIKVNSLTL
jgi:hypothetical protein